MDKAVDRSRPPSRLLLALEVRAIWELQAFVAAYPLLQRAPHGDGHPALVLPGLAASDVIDPTASNLSEGAGLRRAWMEAGSEPRPARRR